MNVNRHTLRQREIKELHVAGPIAHQDGRRAQRAEDEIATVQFCERVAEADRNCEDLFKGQRA
jgi:hypothetical protein